MLVDALRQAAAAAPSAEPLTESLLFEAVRRLGELHDPEWGGFGARAPKFPPASALELLLRRGEAELAVPTLDAMAAGGMYDLVGGGFHRYSVDERWLVPHFEKMLYDNALLVPAYLHGWLVTGRERYREVVEETVEYLLRDLRLPGGGFASSQDADTDGVEGLTYTWAPGEGAPEELLEPFEDGRFVLRGSLDPETRARLLAIRARAAAAGARRQGDRLLERPRARGAGRGGAAARAGGLGRRGARAGRVPARADVASSGRLVRSLRDGQRERAGLPRRLRQRRARALRAARRDRRAALARGVAAAGAARGRALRRRRARRLLPRPGRGRAARRAAQGALRPPGPVGQLDARLRAAAARRGSTATTSSSGARSACCACSARASAAARPSSPGR